ARALLGAVNPLARAEEELCVHLLDRQLMTRERRDVNDPLELIIADVCACPELLALVPPLDQAAVADPDQGVVADVAALDPLRAAAAILARDGADVPPLAKVRQQLVAARRDDLLAGLAPVLTADERTWLADARSTRAARIRAKSEQVGGADAIAAYHLLTDATTSSAELALVEAWLSQR
ncbi:MAG TPA: hypothetical protein VHE35_10295, partial [Kofleriaceae bacterium]|nr:hypothetical protein [Kofleriaceae bacterium]